MSTALNTVETGEFTRLEGLPSSTKTHKLIARYSEALQRKTWVVACGISLEGVRIKQNWADIKCPECRKHKRVVKKRGAREFS